MEEFKQHAANLKIQLETILLSTSDPLLTALMKTVEALQLSIENKEVDDNTPEALYQPPTYVPSYIREVNNPKEELPF